MSEQKCKLIYKLFKQVINQQEVDLEGKTPQEKAEAIVEMFNNTSDDHPLKMNMKKN